MSMWGPGSGRWRATGSWIPGPPGDRDPSTAALFRFLRLIVTAILMLGGFALPLLDQMRGEDHVVHVPRPPVVPDPHAEVEPAEPGTPLAVLQDNSLYRAGGLPTVECPAPPLTDAGARAQRIYHQILFGCLTRAWEEPLRRVGLLEGEPNLFVFSESGTSPCGTFRPVTGRILAFYCPVNETTYVDAEQLADTFPADHHVAYGLVLAHEYGHHTQNVAGILVATSRLVYGSEDEELEFSRRQETQASCFAGMFFSAVAGSYPLQGAQRELFDAYAHTTFGDSPDEPDNERTHGTPRTQGIWIERGLALNDTAVCNTYTTPATEVE